VNTSPALFRAGAVLADLLPRVVEAAFRLAIDPWFPSPPGSAGGAAWCPPDGQPGGMHLPPAPLAGVDGLFEELAVLTAPCPAQATLPPWRGQDKRPCRKDRRWQAERGRCHTRSRSRLGARSTMLGLAERPGQDVTERPS
jgi:hypothetical protein